LRNTIKPAPFPAKLCNNIEENIDFVTTALSKAVETQKEEIEHLHQTALDRINLYEKTVYTIALISLFLHIGLGASLSKIITKDGVELTKKIPAN
jgi:hypothetical protein